MMRVHMFQTMNRNGRHTYLVSPETYSRMREALATYLETYVLRISPYSALEYTPGYRLSLDLFNSVKRVCL